MREVVFGVALPVILPVFMGLDGVLWAFPVSDVLTFAIAGVIIYHTYQEFSLFDPQFQEEIANMKQKNLAVELLKKLISENEALLANDKSARHLWHER